MHILSHPSTIRVPFHILTNVILVRRGIYQLKSAMHEKVFSYSKTGSIPIWLGSKNYSSTLYLVILNEEIYHGKKYGEQKNAYWTPKKS